MGPYPGVLLGGEGRVHGEIYRVTPAVEAQLDHLEGVAPDDSGEYRKRELTVMSGTREFVCLVYEIDPERIRGMPVIRSGDWFARG